MSKTSCSYEQDVLKGLTSGNLTPGLKKHIENCPVCKETFVVHQWMNRFRAVSVETKGAEIKLPDAETIWEKAYASPAYHPGKELEKKALRPLLIPQVLTFAAAVLVVIYLILSNLPGVRSFLDISPESMIIFTSIASMLKKFFKSMSSMAIPMGIGLASSVIFAIISGIERKRDFAGSKK